jgi:hypothetical protein
LEFAHRGAHGAQDHRLTEISLLHKSTPSGQSQLIESNDLSLTI